MAREIKFRGKTLNGDWVEGAYFDMRHDDERKHTHHFIIPDGTPIPKDRPIGDIQVEVREFTVGQFTGVRDQFGTPIYEGDKVRIHMHDRYADEPEYQEGVIVFDDGRFFAKLPHDTQYLSVVNYEDYEVVGNEFDD